MKARIPSFIAKALLSVAPSLSPKRLAARRHRLPVRRTAAGFSLIEVNVAILVIAGGMLSLFTLFPAGLRMSTAAMSDTRQALFADDFFSFVDAGVSSLSIDEWQDVDDFWNAAREGLADGFDINESSIKKWEPNAAVLNSWDPDLVAGDFTKNGTPTLRFYWGKVDEYFSESQKTGKLGAVFVVRIASDFKHENEKGQRTHALDDGLVWRVSLVVSDEDENSWFYDNSVYHRDFRFVQLP